MRFLGGWYRGHRALPRALAIWHTAPILLGLAACGCCDLQGPAYLVGELGTDIGRYEVAWSESNDGYQFETAVVDCYRWEPPEMPSPPMFELYGPDGAIDLPVGVLRNVPGDTEDCGSFDRVEYHFGRLPPGSYLLVHRLSSVPMDIHLSGDAGRVTSFEGEDALVATLVFRE